MGGSGYRRDFNPPFKKKVAVPGITYPSFKKITPIVADSVNTITGTPVGNLADLQTENDGNEYQVIEVAGTPAMDVVIKFVDVIFFNFLRVKAVYNGSLSHALITQLYNHGGAVYETKNIMYHTPMFSFVLGSQVIGCYENKVEDSAKYISAGEVWLRICHPMGGTPNHDLYIDYASIY